MREFIITLLLVKLLLVSYVSYFYESKYVNVDAAVDVLS